MNSTLSLESSIRTPSLGHRVRAAIARLAPRTRRELTRDELAVLREQQLMAERILDEARVSVYAARLF
jgi:hypothetical protein